MSFLKFGSKGMNVVNLQKDLNALGFIVKVDGIFGEKTKSAVIKYQIKKHIAPDGIVGRGTMVCMTRDLGKKQPSKMPLNEPGIPKQEMPWMALMRSHIGEKEISGSKHNPFIVSLFKHTSYKTDKDETPWCAACVCWALEETGYKSTKSAAAKSYKNYGTPCDLRPGCVVVIERDDGGHHVTFCDHIISHDVFAGLGGNQSNQLRISTYKTSRIVATRWPIKKD